MEAKQVQERVGVWFEFVGSVNCHLRVYAFCQGGIIYRTNKFWFSDISLCEAVSQWFCLYCSEDWYSPRFGCNDTSVERGNEGLENPIVHSNPVWKGSDHIRKKIFFFKIICMGEPIDHHGSGLSQINFILTLLSFGSSFSMSFLGRERWCGVLKGKQFDQKYLRNLPHLLVTHTSQGCKEPANWLLPEGIAAPELWLPSQAAPLHTQGFLCPALSQIENKMELSPLSSTFFALSQGFATPLGCRLSYLKPVMTPLYPSEWLICSLKECRWASLIGTWIFLKDVTGSGIGNITHNIK